MNKTEAKKRIEELTKKTSYYAGKYYDEDKPEISDFEYDIKDGYPVQKLESILASKQNSERPKDKIDVENILEYFKTHNN